jgi:hypothetical protein
MTTGRIVMCAKPPGRQQSSANRLILMDEWRDSFAAMICRSGRDQRLQRDEEVKKPAAGATMDSFTHLTTAG